MSKSSELKRLALVSAEGFSEWIAQNEPVPTAWIWLDRISHGFLGQLSGRSMEGLLWITLKDAWFDQIFVWDPRHEKTALEQFHSWFSSLEKSEKQRSELYLSNIKSTSLNVAAKNITQLNDAVIWEALNYQDMPLNKGAGL